MFIKNVLGTFGTEQLLLLLNSATSVLIARVLGPENLGVFSLVTTFPILVAGFANIGIPQANIYFIGKKRNALSDVSSNSLIFSIIIGLIAIAICYSLRDYVLKTLLKGVDAIYLLSIIPMIPLILLNYFLLSMLRGTGRFGLFNFGRLFSSLLRFVGLVFALTILSSGIWGAILTVIAATALTSAYYVLIVSNFAGFKRKFNLPLAKNSVIYGLKSYLQNLFGFLQYRLDLFLIAFFLGKDKVAYYAVAAAVAGMIWHIPDSIGKVLFPKLSSTGKTEDIHHITSIVCRHTIFVTGIAVLMLFATSEFLIKGIYGIEYTHAIRPLLILLPGVVMMSIYKVLARDFSSRNRQQISVAAAASGLTLNVVLNILLIPQLGITGAALSSTVSYSATSGMLLLFFLKESSSSLKETVLMARGDFGVYTDLLSKFRSKVSHQCKRKPLLTMTGKAFGLKKYRHRESGDETTG